MSILKKHDKLRSINSSFFENQVLTVQETALYLKFSEKTVYSMVRDRKIPFRRIGKNIRFVKKDLIEWLGKE